MDAASSREGPLVTEDLLLLLLDPRSGTIVNEATLDATLARGLLVDLVLRRHVIVGDPGVRGPGQVRASGARPPVHPVLREAWHLVRTGPERVSAPLVEVGPLLRETLLDRLVEAGHLRRRGPTTATAGSAALVDGGTWRRRELLASLRLALGPGREPEPRTAVLAGLLSAGGGLPYLHPDILWSRAVWARGKELEQGHLTPVAAGEVVLPSVDPGRRLLTA